MFFLRITGFCLLLLAAACQSGSETTPATAQQQALVTRHFRFSPAKSAKGLLAQGDWCQGDFKEGIPLFPHRTDVSRRYFFFGDGLYKVAVQGASGSSSFFIRRTEGETVDLYTGDNFPTCLSQRQNFTLAADGHEFVYDNGYRNANHYTVGLNPEGGQVEIALPTEGVLGITVHRCANCQ